MKWTPGFHKSDKLELTWLDLLKLLCGREVTEPWIPIIVCRKKR